MALRIFIVLIIFLLLFVLVAKRVDLVRIQVFNVFVIGLLHNRHHDLTVHIVLRISFRQNNVEFWEIANVQLQFGCDVRLVANRECHSLLVAKGHSTEINCLFFNKDFGNDCVHNHRDS